MSHDIALISSEKCLQSCDSKFAQIITQDTLQSACNHNGCLSVATFKSSGGHQSINNIVVVTVRILDDMRTKIGDECDGLSFKI